MGRLPLLFLALALALGAIATAPPAAAHTCVGAACGDCSGPGNHDHTHEQDGSRTSCTSQGDFSVPAPGFAAALAASALAAAGMAALRLFRRPS